MHFDCLGVSVPTMHQVHHNIGADDSTPAALIPLPLSVVMTLGSVTRGDMSAVWCFAIKIL